MRIIAILRDAMNCTNRMGSLGYNWTIILPAELSAAAVLINYWNQSVNNAVWITMCLVVVVTINLFGAGVYGECEFIFA